MKRSLTITLLTLALPAILTGAVSYQRAVDVDDIPTAATDADYHDDGAPPADKVELGRMLFFDKILSGNRNISCATCHHPDHATTDGLALPLGEGARGLGPARSTDSTVAGSVHGLVPRNSPALFNLGAREFDTLFHDGRVEADPQGFYDGGFITPARWKLPRGLDNVLAAQAMFPVVASREMTGQKGENEIIEQVSLNRAGGPGGAWDLLARRLRGIPEYVTMFQHAYPGEIESADDISYVHAANAIAAFEAKAFRADDSPFDRYLRGSRGALGETEKRGMELFYGKAGCGSCHAGTFQTDHDFHAIAMPQIGPGKGDGRHAAYWRETGHQVFLEDLGRGRVTVRPEDDFKFLTPSLRNVALTGPWGHDGAFRSLESVVRHHLDPVASNRAYDPASIDLPELGRVLETTAVGSRFGQDFLSPNRQAGFDLRNGWVQSDEQLRDRITGANELAPVRLDDAEIDAVVRFLEALTDPSSARLSHLVPKRVPSGLPVED